MGIRPVLCLPEENEVLGMETGTFSLEQRNSRRSVGKQTYLKQKSLLPRWARDPNTCHKLPGKSTSPSCDSGLWWGWGSLVTTQVLQGLSKESTQPKPWTAATRLVLLCCWVQSRAMLQLEKVGLFSPYDMLKKHNLVLFLLYRQMKTAFKDGSKCRFPMGYFSIQ